MHGRKMFPLRADHFTVKPSNCQGSTPRLSCRQCRVGDHWSPHQHPGFSCCRHLMHVKKGIVSWQAKELKRIWSFCLQPAAWRLLGTSALLLSPTLLPSLGLTTSPSLQAKKSYKKGFINNQRKSQPLSTEKSFLLSHDSYKVSSGNTWAEKERSSLEYS